MTEFYFELSSNGEKTNFQEVIITNFGPVVGAHVGADSIGVAYIGDE